MTFFDRFRLFRSTETPYDLLRLNSLYSRLAVSPPRYGAPRRNAQERLRSVIMRDERCAETIQRLLDDLDDLLLSRKAGDRGGNLAENLEEKVRGGNLGTVG